MAVDRKYRKALALPCLTVRTIAKCCEFKRCTSTRFDVTRVTQVIVLRKTRVFFVGKCVRTATKTMVVDRKNQKALALLGLVSGSLPNAVNPGVVPTEFAAEHEVLEGKFVTSTFRLPPKRQLSILFNFFLP